ncbi:F-box LRR-repeat 15 [Olea europaea subsp. europaea]|uniref:F-box LRR-repeat 15 n=1 Tax=Olea europaea subsp. europaea TaxID=158383 RepID=A0A8S0VAS1_OLEEU|nr:F-box LRR-repeat 15 [Olea europaea subsp. europaea]
MKIWCFSFIGLGEEEEERNSDISNLDIRYYFNFDNKGIEAMREGILGTGSKDAENDESELVFWEPFGDGSSGGGDDRPGLGFQVDDERVNATDNNENFNFNIEFEKKSEDLLRWIDDLGSSSTGGGRESQGLNVDVNLNLGLGAEASSSLSSTVVQGREDRSRDSQNKRPKVHSLSLDWGSHFENEIHYLSPVHEHVGDEDMPNSISTGDSARKDSDGTLKIEDLEVPMDLTDDLLHMVFTFLDHIDLCRAAMVCRQWREASSHEDFWRYLNFENRIISPLQFEDMCRRYSNANAVNVYGTPAIHSLAMKALSSLRNLEVLTLGKGQLAETFFLAITDCHSLKSLTVNDATFGNGIQEIPIYHDRLRDLQIVKCRVLRVSIRCPQLETLSLKRSSMPHAVLNCPLLHDLDIGSCHKLSDAAIRSAATSCPLLESLDMSNCSCVSDETVREIARVCVNLSILDASYCPNISLESVRLPMLTVLKLHSCEGITSASMAAISYSDLLKVLELDNCSLLASVSLDLPHLENIRLVHCRKFVDLSLRSSVLSSITVSNCPALQRINITSNNLKKLVLQKQESLTSLTLQCPFLQEVDLTECESLTNSICEVFSDGGGCPVLRSLVLDSCESLTAVSFCSTSLVNLSFGGCRAITSVELRCPYLKHVSLDGCDHLERASFYPVGLKSLNLGICPKLNVLHIEASQMVSLELKGCGILSEASINCPLLTSLDASFCSKLKDDCLSATTSSCPLIESLVLMSCPSIGPDGLLSLRCLSNLTNLDLSYTFLVNLQPVFDSCLYLKVLKLQACKYLADSSLEPLYKDGALPALCELDLSYGTLCQSAIEKLLTCCTHLTHVSLNGCVNMHDLNWGFHSDMSSEMLTYYWSFDPSSLGDVFLPTEHSDRLLQNLNCVGCPNIKKVVIPPMARFVKLSSLNLSLSTNLKEVDVSCCNLCFLNLSNCYSLEILKLACPRLTSLFLQVCFSHSTVS